MYLGRMVETAPTLPLWERPGASLQRGADRRRAARGRRRRPAREPPGRGARPGAAAVRLPLPSALPVRVRPLPGRGAAAPGADSRSRAAACWLQQRRACRRSRSPTWRRRAASNSLESTPANRRSRIESFHLAQMAAGSCRSPRSTRSRARPQRSPRLAPRRRLDARRRQLVHAQDVRSAARVRPDRVDHRPRDLRHALHLQEERPRPPVPLLVSSWKASNGAKTFTFQPEEERPLRERRPAHVGGRRLLAEPADQPEGQPGVPARRGRGQAARQVHAS